MGADALTVHYCVSGVSVAGDQFSSLDEKYRVLENGQRTQNDQLKKLLTQQRETVAALTEQIQVLLEDNEALSQQKSELKKSHDQVASQLKFYDSTLQSLEGKFDGLQGQLTKKTGALATAAERLQALEAENVALKAENGKLREAQQKQDDQLEQLCAQPITKLQTEAKGTQTFKEESSQVFERSSAENLNHSSPWIKAACVLLVAVAVVAVFATGGLVEAGLFIYAACTAIVALLTSHAVITLARSCYSGTIFASDEPYKAQKSTGGSSLSMRGGMAPSTGH